MNNNVYKTTDFKLATMLSMSFPLKELINNNGKGTFVFDNSEELTNFINAFYNRELQVEPQAHDDARDNLKNRLYNQVKGVRE